MIDMDKSPTSMRYDEIYNTLVFEYKKLYAKLRNNGVSVQNRDHMSFTDLINNIDRIPAIERYYPSNIKPTDDTIITNDNTLANKILTYNEIMQQEALRTVTSCQAYNLLLAQKINFYMRLMGYYLALKGVPIVLINNARTLDERIDLIDQIDKVILTIFVVSYPPTVYQGSNFVVDYVLKGIDNSDITDGKITVYYEDHETIVGQINTIGEELQVRAPEIGTHNYIFEFTDNSKYKATRVLKKITVLDPNDNRTLYLERENGIFDENQDLTFDFITGSVDRNVNAIVDIDIGFDENDEPYLVYWTESIYGDFNTLDQGLTEINIYAGDLHCTYVDLKTLDN